MMGPIRGEGRKRKRKAFMLMNKKACGSEEGDFRVSEEHGEVASTGNGRLLDI
jgi:hypothetical protein